MTDFVILADKDKILKSLKCCVHCDCEHCPLSNNKQCVVLLDSFIDVCLHGIKEIKLDVV